MATTTTTTASSGHSSSSSSSNSNMVGCQRCSSSSTTTSTNKMLPLPPLLPPMRPPPLRPCKKRDAYSQQQQHAHHHHHVWEDRRILHHDENDDDVIEQMDEDDTSNEQQTATTTTHPQEQRQHRLEHDKNSTSHDDDNDNDEQNALCSSILFSDKDDSSSSFAIDKNDHQEQIMIAAAQSSSSSLRQVAFDLPNNGGMSSMQQEDDDMDHVSSDDSSSSSSSISSSSNSSTSTSSSTTHEHQLHHHAKRRRGGTPHRKAPPPSASVAELGNEQEEDQATDHHHRHYHHRRNNTCAILSFDVSAEEVQESGAAIMTTTTTTVAAATASSSVDSPRWDMVREMKNPTQQQQEYWDLLYGHDAKRMSVSASYSAQRVKPPKGCLSAVKPRATIQQHGKQQQHRSLLRGSFCSGGTYMMMHSPMALSPPSTEQYLTPQHSPEDVVVLDPTNKDNTTTTETDALINTSTCSISSIHSNNNNNHHHRSVQFGSTTAVEYKSDDPVAKSLTPMPNDQAAALYPIDGSRTSAAEETLIQETKDNAALLAAWDVDDDDDDDDDENDNKQMTSMFAVGNNDDDDTDRPYFVATRPLHRPRRSSAFFSPAEGSRNLLGEETNTNHNKSNKNKTSINKDHHVTDNNLASLSSLSVHSPPLIDENGQSSYAANTMQVLQSSPLVDNNSTGDGGGGTRSSSSSTISNTVSVSSLSAQSSLQLDDDDDENIAVAAAASNQHYTASSDSNDNSNDNGSDDGCLSNHAQNGMQHLDSSIFEGPPACSSCTRSIGNEEEDDFPEIFTILTHLAKNWSGESSATDEPIFSEEEPKESSWLQTFASSNRRVLQLCLEAALDQMEEALSANDNQVLVNSKHRTHEHASLDFETHILELVYENLTGTIADYIKASLEHVRSLSSECSSSMMPTNITSLVQEKQAAAARIKELETAICAEEWRKECLVHCQMHYELQRRQLAEWRLQATAGMVRFSVECIEDEEVRLLFPTLLPDCPVRLVSDANGDLCQIHCDSNISTSCTTAMMGGGGPTISKFKVARDIYHALLTAKAKSQLESGDFDDVSDAVTELSLFLTRLNLIMASLIRLFDNGGTCVLTRNDLVAGKWPAVLSFVVTLPKTATLVQLDYDIHNDPHCLVWALPSQVTYLYGKIASDKAERTVVPMENQQYSFSQMCHAEVCATLFERLSTTPLSLSYPRLTGG